MLWLTLVVDRLDLTVFSFSILLSVRSGVRRGGSPLLSG